MSVSEGVVLQSPPPPPPTAISYLNVYGRRKSTNPFGFDGNLDKPCADVNTCMYRKLLNFVKEYSIQKTTRGDNWPAAITGHLPVEGR